MHETAKRLLQVGLAKGEKSFTAIAKLFDGSDQSATNWKTRGVPQRVIILAASRWRVDVAWLSGDPAAVEPECVAAWKYPAPAPDNRVSAVAEDQRGYALAEDEQTLLGVSHR